jgi:hypothetical protein
MTMAQCERFQFLEVNFERIDIFAERVESAAEIEQQRV